MPNFPCKTQILAERWEEYLSLARQGAHFAAFVRIGEIANYLQSGAASSEEKERWIDRLSHVTIPQDFPQSVAGVAAEKIRYVERLLGGQKLEFEEAVLVLTLCMELELVSGYFVERGIDGLPSLASIDELLAAAKWSRQNSAGFESARQACVRNSQLPLNSKWLLPRVRR